MPEYHSSGIHLIADLHGIEPTQLSDSTAMAELLQRSAHAANAHIVYSHFHHFGPGQGVTGVVLLKESHISIHTWPENGFAAVDIFMCGDARPQRALDLIVSTLKPVESKVQCISRGQASRIADAENAMRQRLRSHESQ